MSEITAFIALGSNLEKPELQLQRAVDEIDLSDGMWLQSCSRLYRSDPVGPEDQPDYCNAVISITTSLQPEPLLDTLQTIENHHGRQRSVRWGPRTLDLDILLYGDQQIQSERLTVPHEQMHGRAFVLYPLNDIAPNLYVPNQGTLGSLLNSVPFERLDVIAEHWPWFQGAFSTDEMSS